jgi:hypothetical protein
VGDPASFPQVDHPMTDQELQTKHQAARRAVLAAQAAGDIDRAAKLADELRRLNAAMRLRILASQMV